MMFTQIKCGKSEAMLGLVYTPQENKTNKDNKQNIQHYRGRSDESKRTKANNLDHGRLKLQNRR